MKIKIRYVPHTIQIESRKCKKVRNGIVIGGMELYQ